jgi:hypothetical protein
MIAAGVFKIPRLNAFILSPMREVSSRSLGRLV